MAVNIIGCMSGSSLDGLDIALCRFEDQHESPSWKILLSQTITFPSNLAEQLKQAPLFSSSDLLALDVLFGQFIGDEIRKWMDEHHVSADLIASHGHTVFHDPARHFTFQIGNGSAIALATNVDTITSFRSADIAAGGQGAPFAPVADRDLFPGYDAYLNLGGIVNVSTRRQDGTWQGWDIGPCNQALNHLARKAGLSYDQDGKLARQGKADASSAAWLVSLFPYQAGRPKGMSNEEVRQSWITWLDQRHEPIPDLLATCTEGIALLIHQHLVNISGRILVTGGGAHNTYLIERLRSLHGDRLQFEVPANDIVDYKECLLMAWLGYLHLHNRAFGIHQITGATTDTIGGALHKATR